LRFIDNSSLLETICFTISRNETKNILFIWNTTISTSIGLHVLRVTMGAQEKSLSINVFGKPYLYVLNFTVNKPNITTGDWMSIRATVVNNGSADSIDTEINFYVDQILIKTIRENITQGNSISPSIEWSTKNVKVGDHALKVVVENSTKQLTVNVKPKPTTVLDNPFPIWILFMILLFIMVLVIVLGYNHYKKKRSNIKEFLKGQRTARKKPQRSHKPKNNINRR